jgi:hypothetical protein
MTVTPDERKAVGDAWGRLAGAVVDACKSHHECHCGSTREKPVAPGQRVTISKAPCVRSGGVQKYEAIVFLPATAATTPTIPLAISEMHLLEAGQPMAPQPLGGNLAPDHLMPNQGDRIKVGVEAVSPPGLYVGHVCQATGAPPNVPVIIFIDGLD